MKNIGGNKETFLYLTNLQGVLEITDVDKFVEFYKEGVGRQKSYGAGMLMLYWFDAHRPIFKVYVLRI